MKYRYLSIIFLILILSTGAVCAQEDAADASGDVLSVDTLCVQEDAADASSDVLSADNDISGNELGSGNSIEINDDNYNSYFSEIGTILENANISDNDVIILGNINDKIFDIDRPLTITSGSSPINNTEITLNKGSDNSIIENLTIRNDGDITPILVSDAENITIISNKFIVNSIGNDNYVDAVFANLADNLKIMDNTFKYVGRDNDTHYNSNIVIVIVESDGVLIEKNNITFDVETDETASNKVILASQSEDIVITRNTINATLPSRPIDWYTGNVYSEGICLDDCNEIDLFENKIDIASNGYVGDYATLYGVHITGENATVHENIISVAGAPFIYGLVMSVENFTVFGNIILAGDNITELLDNLNLTFFTLENFNSYNNVSERFEDIIAYAKEVDFESYIENISPDALTSYVDAIDIEGDSKGLIEFNLIIGIGFSPYGLYTANWAGDVQIETALNLILAYGSYVFGMFLSGSEALVEYTLMEVFGNYTTGIASTIDNTVIHNNTIIADGSNVGPILTNDMMGIETTAVHIVSGNAAVKDNYMYTTGKYAVDFKGEGSVTDNELYAELLTGDFAVDYIQNSGVLVKDNVPEMVLDYILTNDTFCIYFDEEGKIREQITADNLTFMGDFSNLVDKIIIDRPIALISDDAVLYDMAIFIQTENVSVEGFNLIGELAGIDVSDADNVEIMNSFFTVTCEGDFNNLAISIHDSNNVSIVNNTIILGAKTNGTYKNRAVHAQYCENLNMTGNTIVASIPARPIDWTSGTVYSNGVILEGCDNAFLFNNNVAVKANDNISDYDTIYAVGITGNNATVIKNRFGVLETPYGYGIVISGENFKIAENEILVGQDGTYACAIEVDGTSNGVIDANSIYAIADESAYGIYTANWAGDVKADITNNFIYAYANSPFALSLSGSEALAENNTILVQGNFTTGIASAVANIVIHNNTIIANGSNAGTPAGYDMMGIETTGIHIVGGNSTVTDNNITTTGEYSVDAKGTGKVTDNYLVAAKYTGDASVDNVTGETFVLNNIPPMQRIIIEAEAVVMYYKNGARYAAKVSDANGHPLAGKPVTFTVNGDSYNITTNENGTASLNINLTPGTYNVTVEVGNETADSLLTVLSTINASDVESKSRNLVFEATFLDGEGNCLADGTDVSFNINGTIYNSQVSGDKGLASINLTLDSGRYTITSQNTVTDEKAVNSIAVDSKDAEMILSGDEIIAGENATIGVTLSSDATGNVTAKINGKTYPSQVKNGKATIIIPDLSAGNYSVPVTYSGDYNYNSAKGDANVTVNKINATITVDVPAITEGENATVTVTLPEDATGNVTVKSNGKTIATAPVTNGKAKLSMPLESGTHALEITYSGDDKYAPASENKTITVNRIATHILVDESFRRYSTDCKAGERGGNITAYLLDENNNPLSNMPVQFTVNGKTYNLITNDTGAFSLQINLKMPKTYAIALAYTGNDKYNATTATSKLVIVQKKTSIKASDKTFRAKAKTKTIQVTLKTVKNQFSGKTYIREGKKLTLVVKGKRYTKHADAKGIAVFTVKLRVKGTYTAKITFEGDKIYTASTKKIKITIK